MYRPLTPEQIPFLLLAYPHVRIRPPSIPPYVWSFSIAEMLGTIRSYRFTISRGLASLAPETRKPPQTYIEKIVQKYAVDLPAGKTVRAGDYVMIRPEHVMSHDNTGPIMTKYVFGNFLGLTADHEL